FPPTLKLSGPLKFEARRNSWLICQERSSFKSCATSLLLQPSCGSQKMPLAEHTDPLFGGGGMVASQGAPTSKPSHWNAPYKQMPAPLGSAVVACVGFSSTPKAPGLVLKRL